MNRMNGGTKYFLATTALKDFWDTSYRIVFLGEWCKRYSSKSFWENIESDTIKLPIDEQDYIDIYVYLDRLFEQLLPYIADTMNRVHQVSFSVRFWRIILGPWLLHYMHALHDRYLHIIHAKEHYPDFTTICLDEECFAVPLDTSQFIQLIRTDEYNLQIYSKILSKLGYQFSVKTNEKNKLSSNIPQHLLKNTLYTLFKKFYGLIVKKFQNDRQILFRNPYFPLSALVELIIKAKGNIWPCVFSSDSVNHINTNYEARALLNNINFGSNEFEKILIQLVAFDMPQSMVEGFQIYRKKILQYFVEKPKAIMSTTLWHYDNDAFKIWAAESAEGGSTLLGIQHGGNYGSAAYFIQENHELNIVDKFYSWGWNNTTHRATIIPLSSPKLIKIKKMPVQEDDTDLLFIMSIWSRYLIQYPFTNEYWVDYFSQQALFLTNISDELKKYIRVRPHREDLGWDVIPRLKDLIPEIRIEQWNVPFLNSLKKSRILICDHPLNSTTFFESLKSNKPTVLFYNPNFAANYIRAESSYYYNKLKEAMILFDDPVSAAKHLDAIYDDVGYWWEEPKRQAIINEFVDRFAKTNAGWLKEWGTELNRVLSA